MIKVEPDTRFCVNVFEKQSEREERNCGQEANLTKNTLLLSCWALGQDSPEDTERVTIYCTLENKAEE